MRASRVLVVMLLLAIAGATSADAASRAISVSGTATGNGQVDIIIEDNNSPNRSSDRREVIQVTVPINQGSTAEESALTTRDTLDIELPPRYNVFLFNPTTIVIEQPGPIVMFKVLDNVPTQVFQEVPSPIGGGRTAPAAPAALAVAVLGMLAVAARKLRHT